MAASRTGYGCLQCVEEHNCAGITCKTTMEMEADIEAVKESLRDSYLDF